jgi:hypothetical protein
MTVEDLLTIHEIRQLKYRYMRCIDTQDWDLDGHSSVRARHDESASVHSCYVKNR